MKLNFSCNNRCTFCHAVDNPPYAGNETRFAVQKMRRAKAMGAEMVVFSGGESTIRRDFFLLVRAARALGLKHGVITNGRMLSYPEFAERYLSYEPDYVYVSLHGAKASTHNRMVLAPAFDQVIEGLRNVSGRVADLTVNAVVTRANMRELKAMVDLLLPLSPIRLKFSYVEPKGNAHRQFEDVVPPIHEAARYVNEAIAYGEEKGSAKGLQMGCENFVPCLIDDYQRYNADLFTDNFIYMSESIEETFFPVDSGRRIYLPPCSDCSLKEGCQGLFEHYVKGVGAQNIRVQPVKKPVPSGFSYTFVKSFPATPGDCPIAGRAMTGLDPYQDLFLQENDKVSLCRAGAMPFTPENVRQVKRQFQQIYLDCSDPDRGGGFADFEDYKRSRRKLRLRSGCSTCAKLSACPATYEVFEGEEYGAVERKIEQALGRLRGYVLDVGCGRILYGHILRELVRMEKIRYLGVDPEPASLNGLHTVRIDIEEFQCPEQTFDVALVLRSYNHFYDLQRAFDVILRALKPGGDLIVVENGPSLVVRKKEHRGGGRLEHYRNHTSHDALRFLQENYPLSVVEHVPLMPEQENQWLLHLQKSSAVKGRLSSDENLAAAAGRLDKETR